MGVYFKEVEVPINVDGIRIDLYFDDGHIETHIIKEAMHLDLVTCGECKFWESAKNGWNGYCNKKVDAFNTFYKTDWCSFGERRADDSNT